MATKEIKQKIVLEGEKQYNAAIKEAQRNLRTLKSELKAETAELGKNATEQQKAEAKTKSLKAQIKEQEKIVKTLRDALKEAKEQYGDNSDEVAKWEIKLNNARATLGNMKSDLEGVGSGLKTMSTDAAAATVATKSVADALGTIGSAGQSVSDAIEGIFTGLIDTIADAVGEVWELISQTAARANNWTDLARYYGSTAAEMQKWDNSIKAAGGDFDKFLGIVNKLAFGGKEKKITELIGVSKENYEDDIKYTMAVLDELQRKKEKLGQGWYDSAMSELFGARKSADVSWFLSNMYGHEGATGDWIYGWRDGADRFNGDQTGYGMSTEELATMNDVWVKINEIATKWEALKESFAAGFGVAALDLMVNVSGTLDGIADYMNATDDAGREAALKKIRENVEQFFTKLGEIIRESIHILHDVGMELSESDDPLTAAIGDILVKLSEALQWMVDNQDAVKKAFEAIFGIWLLAKLAAVAGSLGKILLSIEAIKTFKGISVATTAAEAAGATAGTSWGTGFAGAVMKAVPWLAGLLVLLDTSNHGSNDITDENGNLTQQAIEDGYFLDENGEVMHANFTETPEQKAKREWVESERARYKSEGKTAALWALDEKQHYRDLQDFWDKYRTASYTSEDWDKLRGSFGTEESWAAALPILQHMYTMDRNEADIPDWVFGLESRWGDQLEEIDLDEENPFTEEDRENAVQDWWDAWRNAANGEDSWDEENSAFEWFKEVFGDDFGEVYDRIIAELDKLDEKKQLGLDDLPADWWTVTSSWGGASSGSADENGITSADLEGFLGVPSGVEKAAEKGVKKGISGLRVEIDGQTAGRILAPYVSEEIAKSID